MEITMLIKAGKIPKPASPTKHTTKSMHQLILFVRPSPAAYHCQLHICFAGSYFPACSRMPAPGTVSNYAQGWGGMSFHWNNEA